MTFGTVTQAVTDEAVLADQNDDRKAGNKSESAYRTISEVAQELNLPQHVLRFWESKFKQISPLKRGGGRRYYRQQDIALIKRIHHLLHTQGYTIKGVQKLLVKDRQLSAAVPGEIIEDIRNAAQSHDESAYAAAQQPVASNSTSNVGALSNNSSAHAAHDLPLLNRQPASAGQKINTDELSLILGRLKKLRDQVAARN